jgi:hypothetical protein
MEFKNPGALWHWLVSLITRLWRALPGAIGRAVVAASPVLTADFWIKLPGRVRHLIWLAIVAIVLFVWRILTAIWRWVSRPLDWSLRRALRAAGIALIVIFAGSYIIIQIAIRYPGSQVEPNQPEHTIYYLDQGWGTSLTTGDPDHDPRQTFYYTPQGTSILATGFRYSWFIHMERAQDQEPFAAPEHMRALGFQVDNVPTPRNPDNLPVGFTRHFAPEFDDEVVDITCAACHTGELHVQVNGKNAGIRIDGGQGMHAFTSTSPGQFGTTLTAAMGATLFNPFKFRRFALAVLGKQYPKELPKLTWDFTRVLYSLLAQTVDDVRHNRYPVEEGFGRTDAIGRIANRAFGTDLDKSNFAQGNAPVSYPAIWDAHHWDWVQYTASVAQPMARNVGETLGVGATLGLVDTYKRPLPEADRFVSLSRIEDLKKIEETIAELKPPEWREDLLGPINQDKAKDGRKVFAAHCARCHEPCLLPPERVAVERPLLLKEYNKELKEDKPLWHLKTIPVENIGTDPQAAMNFVNRRINLEKTGITRAQVLEKVKKILEERQQRRRDYAKAHNLPDPGPGEDEIRKGLDAVNINSASIGQALNYVDMFIQDKYYKELGISKGHQDPKDNELTVEQYDGDGALDAPQVLLEYKARPLGGVWATAPYLHNGSVPTLYDLLSPTNERPRKFSIRNRMDFDPVRVGLVASPASAKGFWVDTTIPGNRNTGHEFRAGGAENFMPSNGVIGPELTPEQRWDVIEYLKVYKEEPQACPLPAAQVKGRPW